MSVLWGSNVHTFVFIFHLVLFTPFEKDSSVAFTGIDFFVFFSLLPSQQFIAYNDLSPFFCSVRLL